MKFYYSLFSLFVIFTCFSCGEDRTYEYEAKTQHNKWVASAMQEWYLWGDLVSEQEWKSYFAKPTDFFSKIVKNKLF
jgi:hypothetical protein